MGAANDIQGFQSIQTRQDHIHHDDIGMQSLDLFHGLLAIAGDSRHLMTRLGKEPCEKFQRHIGIVDD